MPSSNEKARQILSGASPHSVLEQDARWRLRAILEEADKLSPRFDISLRPATFTDDGATGIIIEAEGKDFFTAELEIEFEPPGFQMELSNPFGDEAGTLPMDARPVDFADELEDMVSDLRHRTNAQEQSEELLLDVAQQVAGQMDGASADEVLRIMKLGLQTFKNMGVENIKALTKMMKNFV